MNCWIGVKIAENRAQAGVSSISPLEGHVHKIEMEVLLCEGRLGRNWSFLATLSYWKSFFFKEDCLQKG